MINGRNATLTDMGGQGDIILRENGTTAQVKFSVCFGAPLAAAPVGHCPGCLIPAAAAAFRMYSIIGRIAFMSVPMTLSSFSYMLRSEL